MLRLSVDEFRTTLCDCETLELTRGKMVRDKTMGEGMRESRRLRVCLGNTDARGKERDVSASRNLWMLTVYQYFGIERPLPFQRRVTREVLSLGHTYTYNAYQTSK